MPRSYSEDLRKRVIEFLLEGNSYDKASKLFKISVSAIGRWYRRYHKEGIYHIPYSPDYNPIEKFWANMKRWIENNIANFNELYDSIESFFNIPTST